MKNPFAKLLNKPSIEEEAKSIFRQRKAEYLALYELLSKTEGMQQKLSKGVMALDEYMKAGETQDPDERLWCARLIALQFMELYLNNYDLISEEKLSEGETTEASIQLLGHSLEFLAQHPIECMNWVASLCHPEQREEVVATINQVQIATA